MPGNVVVAFDAYGTLLSTESIANQLAKHFGQDEARTIAATWRKYQLEYTWRLNSMSKPGLPDIVLISAKDAVQVNMSLSQPSRSSHSCMRSPSQASLFAKVILTAS